MKRSEASGRIVLLLSTGVLVCGALTAVLPRIGVAGEPGMTIYRDPTTGQFVPPPAGPPGPSKPLPTPSPGSSTSHADLVERPSVVPGGGVIIDLEGRFRGPLTATVDADGKVTIQHQPSLPATGTRSAPHDP